MIHTRHYTLATIASLVILSARLSAETIPLAVQQFATKYCSDCHDEMSREAGLDFSALKSELSDAGGMEKWIRVHDRVRSGEMPPMDSAQPTAQERQDFLNGLAASLTAEHRANKGTVLRRLNRIEFENTLNDLFGTNLRLAELLPPDGRSREFDNIGKTLSMSMVQLRQYIEAINRVLDASIAGTVEAPEPIEIKTNYDETREGEKFIGDKWLKAKDGAVVFFQDLSYPTGMLRTANTRKSGWYRIRVTGYAYQSNEPVTFSVGATTFQRGFERPTFGYFSFDPGEPSTVELTAWIEDRYMLEIAPYGIYDEKYEIKNKGIENYSGPGLAITSVELKGPIHKQFPSQGHHLLFDGISRQEIQPRNPRDKEKSWYQPQFQIISDHPRRDAEKVLLRVAEKAFRRPVSQNDVAPFVDLFLKEMSQESSFEESLRTAVSALFCSPQFLYFQESPGKLDDYAVANRLSYFLTRSAPDKELIAAAAAGKLSQDNRFLRQQTERLLKDQDFTRFVNDFTDAWLNLRDIEFTTPDKNLFPEYDPYLLFSMLNESREYFSTQIKENLPVTTIVKSDFAMINNRLAQLYGIDGVEGTHIRKVLIPQDSLRGGYLGQASVLKVSANGTNTSPVVRGVWVLERILGEHAPPPPPGVPGVEPDIRGAATLRELLAKHRDSDNCRACHEMIDPPGFALECFNPIGGFRERYRSLGDGEKVTEIVHGRKVRYRLALPVDATGHLEDGRHFANFKEFREMLATEKEELTQAFVEKLLIFACGRELGFSDRQEVDRIVKQAMQAEHGMRDLVHAVVQSNIFLTK